jgi:hypothetical protein
VNQVQVSSTAIWPDVRQMSEHDQRVLAYLAMRCRLDREPMVAQNVVAA